MFWVGLSLGKVIGFAAVGLIVLIAACLGCVTVEKPNVRVSLFDGPEPGQAQGRRQEATGKGDTSAPQQPGAGADVLENDPRWKLLE